MTQVASIATGVRMLVGLQRADLNKACTVVRSIYSFIHISFNIFVEAFCLHVSWDFTLLTVV